VACSKKPVVPHPGTFNAFDSQAYDRLGEAQVALAAGKSNIQQGLWPSAWGEYVDLLGKSYNVALASYNTYHNVLAGKQAGDVNALQVQLAADLETLTLALADFKTKTGGK
jgi:hypothetical protein